MTIQFSQVELAEARLYPDSCKQTSSDQSFEEKLKLAQAVNRDGSQQARLGLLFMPFSQFESLFSSTIYGGFESSSQKTENNLFSFLEEPKQAVTEQYAKPESSSLNRLPTPQMFESVPVRSFNRQFLQQLLTQTGWLVPNLAAQPTFYSAFLEGKLQLKLDMQSLIDQIAEQVKMVKGKEKTELSLTLKPEELGEIILVLTSRSGIVSIQIQASAETKKLIDSQRSELEQGLKKAKVAFDEIKVQEVERYV